MEDRIEITTKYTTEEIELLDKFATAALPVALDHHGMAGVTLAYDTADAMIAERRKRLEPDDAKS